MSTVLVPTDFSKNATAALRYAIQLCKQMESDLIVFHCSHISAYALSSATTEEQMSLLLSEDEAHKMEKLQDQVDKAYKHEEMKVPDSTRLVVSYNPMFIEKTLEIAKENKVSLIVMGTHGASGITKFFFGSNTSVMISKSDIPVMAIPESQEYEGIDEVVFASDLQSFSFELTQLMPFAQATKCTINVLYMDYHLDPDGIKIKAAQDIIEKMPYKKIKLQVQPATLDTSLVAQVKKYLSTHKPDCLVMFTRERTLWDRLFLKGSKTEDMSAALNTPLLSFKKG